MFFFFFFFFVLFSGGLKSINDSNWLQLQLGYFVSESHEGSNLAPLTKEESMATSHMYLFFSVLHVPCFTNTLRTKLKQAINMWAEKDGSTLPWAVMGRNGYGPN